MRTIANKFIFVIIHLLGGIIAFAAPKPPPPDYKKPPPPPGLPIDENISVLVIMAILLGFYIIYKYHLKTKAPI
ncbi:MAG TPA: hypothetical protein VLR29_10610 [Flavobacterium sp.]|nr:hypothetical protein [Flavobacterium sp.]